MPIDSMCSGGFLRSFAASLCETTIAVEPSICESQSNSRSGGESIRTKDWRFTQWGYGEKGLELYDLKKEPGEFTNQARNPEYASVVKTLRAQLIAKRDAAGFKQNRTAIIGKPGKGKQKK